MESRSYHTASLPSTLNRWTIDKKNFTAPHSSCSNYEYEYPCGTSLEPQPPKLPPSLRSSRDEALIPFHRSYLLQRSSHIPSYPKTYRLAAWIAHACALSPCGLVLRRDLGLGTPRSRHLVISRQLVDRESQGQGDVILAKLEHERWWAKGINPASWRKPDTWQTQHQKEAVSTHTLYKTFRRQQWFK